MYRKLRFFAVPFSVAILFAADASWQSKAIQQWTGDDAKEVLKSSPWIKIATPRELPKMNEAEIRQSGHMGGTGGGQGVGFSAINQSTVTGIGGRPQVRRRARQGLDPLEIRWESALPVRAAELKAGEDDPPDWQGSFYAVAVYDVPGIDVNSKAQHKELTAGAFLKRDGQKDLKPVRVNLLPQEGGLTTVVYLFPRTEEIKSEEKRVEFAAVFGQISVAQYFYPQEMQFQGKLEL
jgi:hypothetical protein